MLRTFVKVVMNIFMLFLVGIYSVRIYCSNELVFRALIAICIRVNVNKSVHYILFFFGLFTRAYKR